MKFIDMLRKLGIFRSGAVSGTYKSAADRPIELQMEGVYDAKKDLIGVGDNPKPQSTQARKAPRKSLAIVIVSVSAAALMLLLSLTSTVGWLIALVWIGWVVIVWLHWRGKVTWILRWWLIFWIVVVVSFVTILVTQTDTESNGATGTQNTQNTQNTSNSSDSNNVSTSSSGKEIHDCAFTAQSGPVVPSGYSAKVFSSTYKDVAVGEARPETSTSVYYLKDFDVAANKMPKDTVYFYVTGANGQAIPGVRSVIEVCNQKTNKSTDIAKLSDIVMTPTSSNTHGVESYLSAVSVPDGPGAYRVDGLISVNDGQWQLVARKVIEFK